MLETVRIRRAGYNVRLSYEEFIQLYRILLPKGLVSSQKDVRDFMNTMDLNKQHYQLGKLLQIDHQDIRPYIYSLSVLGITKIYMRESQKTRLDMKLHKKIIESIVMIQRWFRGILQRRKFVLFRSAAITLQSFWRMCSAQKQYLCMRQERAAVLIQSTWRMVTARRWYQKLRLGAICVQSHIRGKLARARFKKNYKQKLMRDRSKLKQQSLPMNERSIDCPPELQDYYMGQRKASKPHLSLDVESRRRVPERDIYKSSESIHRYSPPLITPQLVTGYVAEYPKSSRRSNISEYHDRPTDDYHDYQNLQKVAIEQQQLQFEDSVDKIAKGYDLVKASKIYNDPYDISK